MNIKNDSLGKNRETIRDYLLLVLFTGLRKEEAACLTWANVDLKTKTLKVNDTKNHLDHTLPLSIFSLIFFSKEMLVW
jgi:integrase